MDVSGAILSTLVPLPLKYALMLPVQWHHRPKGLQLVRSALESHMCPKPHHCCSAAADSHCCCVVDCLAAPTETCSAVATHCNHTAFPWGVMWLLLCGCCCCTSGAAAATARRSAAEDCMTAACLPRRHPPPGRTFSRHDAQAFPYRHATLLYLQQHLETVHWGRGRAADSTCKACTIQKQNDTRAHAHSYSSGGKGP
jgi:hypothetical protein